MHVARAIRANYADLRGWAIFAQLFLGFGWLRAAVAHVIEPTWWNGVELTGFVNTHAGDSVDAYRPFVEELVMRFPSPVSWGVLALEFVAAALLIINLRPDIGLTIGGFLNVQFILAGQVNPSVFYLVLALGLLLWHLERAATPKTSRRHGRRAAAIAVLALALFGPSIRTVDPALAIEDPALVIVFLAWLVAGTMWLGRQDQTTDDVLEAPAEREPLVLDLKDLDEARIESTLPMMLSLQKLDGISPMQRRQRSSIDAPSGNAGDVHTGTDTNTDTNAGDDDAAGQPQPRIRDLTPNDQDDDQYLGVVDIV